MKSLCEIANLPQQPKFTVHYRNLTKADNEHAI